MRHPSKLALRSIRFADVEYSTHCWEIQIRGPGLKPNESYSAYTVSRRGCVTLARFYQELNRGKCSFTVKLTNLAPAEPP